MDEPLSLHTSGERVANETVGHARQLRRTSTDAEKLLWRYLRNRQLANCKFRRQVPIDRYIADFVCLEAKLIIELDGGQHADRQVYDEQRSQALNRRGYRVIRFWNNEVMTETSAVLERVRSLLLQQSENDGF